MVFQGANMTNSNWKDEFYYINQTEQADSLDVLKAKIDTIQNDNTLITIDITTGVFTNVATITGITGGQTITGVAYDETNDIMYLGTTNITSSELYTLDVSTGAATLVGVIGQSGLIALGVNCAGEMYSVDLVTDDLWSIDPGTGAGTSVGPLGIDINFCQDIDFDATTGAPIGFDINTLSKQ